MSIATDGLSLDLLSTPNVHWATIAHSTGLSSAYLMSFNLFLTFNQASVSTVEKLDLTEILAGSQKYTSSAKFLVTWGLIFILGALSLAPFKGERNSMVSTFALRQAYGMILEITKKPPVQMLILVHLTLLVGFQTNDSITMLQLVRNGFTHRAIAWLATVSFPCEILTSFGLGVVLRQHHPLNVAGSCFHSDCSSHSSRKVVFS